jgi:hypothetical protein
VRKIRSGGKAHQNLQENEGFWLRPAVSDENGRRLSFDPVQICPARPVAATLRRRLRFQGRSSLTQGVLLQVAVLGLGIWLLVRPDGARRVRRVAAFAKGYGAQAGGPANK